MLIDDNYIINYFFNNNKIKGQLLQEKHIKTKPEIKEYLDNRFPFTNIYKEIVYLIYNNINEEPVCPVCGKPTHFIKFNKGYSKFCSRKCEHSKKGTQIKEISRKATCQERYNTDFVLQNDIIREKCRNTMNKLYNVNYSGESDLLLNKMKDTNKKRYKSEFPL